MTSSAPGLRGLRARIILALGGILLLYGTLAVSLILLDKRALLSDALQEQGEMIALHAGDSLWHAWSAAERDGQAASREEFARVAAAALNRAPDMVRFSLVDLSGRVLYDSHRQGPGDGIEDPTLAETLLKSVASGTDRPARTRQIERDGRPVLEILRLLATRDRPEGAIVVELSLDSIGRAMWSTSLAVLTAALLFFLLLGATLSWITSRAVLQPVMVLSAAAQALGQGFLDARVDEGGSYEMAALARAFATMAADLKGIVAHLSSLADEVSQASSRILEKGAEVAAGTAEQAGLTRRTGLAVEKMTDAARDVARTATRVSGLSERVNASFAEMTLTSDEIAGSARTLGDYVDRTHDAVLEISGSVGDVAGSAGALRSLSADAARAVQEMHATIEEIRNRAGRSQALSAAAHAEAATLGAASVDQAVAGMDRLRGIVERSVGLIETLARRSDEVGRIATFIDEVTERTRLLGINASILAAQAGEHGRGFAVVAEEIKSLSVTIAGSTRDINRLLDAMRQEAADAAGIIREGSRSAAEGVALSEGVRGALAKIVDSSAESGRMLAAIALATDGQTEATGHIRELVERVAEGARMTADASGQQKIAAHRIADAIDGMRALADQVTRSTQEHSANSKSVAEAMRELGEGVEAIAGAARHQLEQARPVIESLVSIRDQAEGNRTRAEEVADTIHALLLRADTLRAELSRFRFRGSPHKPARDVGPVIAAASDTADPGADYRSGPRAS
jgi:methyl-accepting chemotaxis protein